MINPKKLLFVTLLILNAGVVRGQEEVPKYGDMAMKWVETKSNDQSRGLYQADIKLRARLFYERNSVEIITEAESLSANLVGLRRRMQRSRVAERVLLGLDEKSELRLDLAVHLDDLLVSLIALEDIEQRGATISEPVSEATLKSVAIETIGRQSLMRSVGDIAAAPRAVDSYGFMLTVTRGFDGQNSATIGIASRSGEDPWDVFKQMTGLKSGELRKEHWEQREKLVKAVNEFYQNAPDGEEILKFAKIELDLAQAEYSDLIASATSSIPNSRAHWQATAEPLGESWEIVQLHIQHEKKMAATEVVALTSTIGQSSRDLARFELLESLATTEQLLSSLTDIAMAETSLEYELHIYELATLVAEVTVVLRGFEGVAEKFGILQEVANVESVLSKASLVVEGNQ